MELPIVEPVKVDRKTKRSFSALPIFLGLMVGGVALIGATTYFLVNRTDSANSVEELTITVKRQPLTLRIKASGTVQPVKRIEISPKTTDRLQELRVRQGQMVEKGQLLAVMENDDIKAQGIQVQADLQQAVSNLAESKVRINGEIAQAKARLEQAEARLGEAVESLPRRIKQAEEQTRGAAARLRLAQTRVQRHENLLKEGAISQDRFQEIVTEYLDAKAAFDEAQQRLEETQRTNTPEIRQWIAARDEAGIAFQQRRQTAQDEINRLQAAAASVEGRLLEVKERMEDTYIIAPFSGLVTQIDAEVGEIVAPTLGSASNSILTLAEGLEVLAKVPEVDVGQLQRGQPVEIFADAYPDQVFPGRVKLVAPEAVKEDDVTYFEVKIAMPEEQQKLRSKMNVDVAFLGRSVNNAIVVPTVAIVTKDGETGVIVADEQEKPKFKTVTLGSTVEDKTQILQGIEPGEKVFTDLTDKMQKDLGLKE